MFSTISQSVRKNKQHAEFSLLISTDLFYRLFHRGLCVFSDEYRHLVIVRFFEGNDVYDVCDDDVDDRDVDGLTPFPFTIILHNVDNFCISRNRFKFYKKTKLFIMAESVGFLYIVSLHHLIS